MKKFTLTLVRHGESTANVSHRLSGNLDVSLTEKGKRELEEMKEKVDYPDADICFSSPLSMMKEPEIRCIPGLVFKMKRAGRTVSAVE